jgi:hypothetical protein
VSRFASIASGAACIVLGLLGGSAASDPGERAIDESHRGFPYYREYCAPCHGLFADGLGPVVPALRSRPPDLSTLSSKYGSPLPVPALIEIIDGRDMVRAHGSVDMPVWGTRLFEALPPTASKEAARRQTMMLVVEYLDAIQREPGAQRPAANE